MRWFKFLLLSTLKSPNGIYQESNKEIRTFSFTFRVADVEYFADTHGTAVVFAATAAVANDVVAGTDWVQTSVAVHSCVTAVSVAVG